MGAMAISEDSLLMFRGVIACINRKSEEDFQNFELLILALSETLFNVHNQLVNQVMQALVFSNKETKASPLAQCYKANK